MSAVCCLLFGKNTAGHANVTCERNWVSQSRRPIFQPKLPTSGLTLIACHRQGIGHPAQRRLKKYIWPQSRKWLTPKEPCFVLSPYLSVSRDTRVAFTQERCCPEPSLGQLLVCTFMSTPYILVFKHSRCRAKFSTCRARCRASICTDDHRHAHCSLRGCKCTRRTCP